MWWFHDVGGWWLWVVTPFAMVSVWGVAIWALVRFSGDPVTRAGDRPSGRDPAAVLADRRASGEIDADEHPSRREILRELTGARGTSG